MPEAGRTPRVLAGSWPDWPVVAAGYPPDVPAVVMSGNRVLAATPAARAEGVREGLRRREAQSRCPEVVVEAADPGRDARVWEPVVAAVEELTPTVEVLGPGSLGFSTRGPSRYFGGDAALAEAVRVAIEQVVGHAGCRVGVADGRFTAALAASLSPGRPGDPATVSGCLVVPPGGSRRWLAPLPVRVLGAGFEDLADLLVRLGLRTLGDLAALPAPAVLGRFGPEGQVAHRLARGMDGRPVQARVPPTDLTCVIEMDPPEQRIEAAAFAAKILADRLHARLEARCLVATMVAIELETEHGERLVRHWRHEGALSASALADRVRWQAVGWLSGGPAGGRDVAGVPTGGLTSLRLTPEEVHPDTGRQMGLWGGHADSDVRAGRVMARVQGLLGLEAVSTAELVGGRGSSEQVRLVPWGDHRDMGARSDDGRRRRAPRSPAAPWPGRLPDPSPVLVHRPPLAACLLDATGEEVRVSGRGIVSAAPTILVVEGGRHEEVVRWAGPWPLEERWWEGGGRRRARVQLEARGGEAYLVCLEGSRWWLEASYG